VSLGLDIHQHLWDHGGAYKDFSGGQTGEEEVHGVWRWESELIARIMSRFPMMVTRCMDRNRLKMNVCSSGSSVSHKRMNSEILVWFVVFMFLMNIAEKME
jgi:hypothetical protein